MKTGQVVIPQQGALDRLSLGWQCVVPLPWFGQPVVRKFWGRAEWGSSSSAMSVLPAAVSSSLPGTALGSTWPLL